MTKRISRKALALAAIGALAAPAFATVANAQIITKTIAVTLKAVGPVPTGVTGANVSVVCVNTTSTPGAIASNFTLTPGQTANLNNFLLTSAAPGSSCTVTATNAGSANTGRGTITIAVGGATSGPGFATGGSIIPPGLQGAGSVTLTAGPVAVFDSTDVQITMSFPQITVKKVVVGDEATAGFAYPMSIACSNPVSPIFVSPANGLEAGGAGFYVDLPITATVTPGAKAFIFSTASTTKRYVWTDAVTGLSNGPAGVVTSGPNPIPATALAGTITNVPNVLVSPAPNSYTYLAGDVVIPGANTVSPISYNYFEYSQVTAAGALTPASPAVNTYRVVDASFTVADIALLQAGLPANIQVVSGKTATAKPAVAGYNVPVAFTSIVNGTAYTAGFKASIPALDVIDSILLTLPAFTATTTGPSSVRVYDYRTDVATIPAGGILGNWAALGVGNPSLYTLVVNQINKLTTAQPTPNVAGGFTGSFSLKGGASQSFSFNEFPNLTTSSKCEVWETNGGGASVTAFSSTNGTAAPLAGLNNANGRFQSSLTAMNETITVTNSFLGDMIISKVVTGDPKTNVATYEISVACDKGGPKDTFLIKDRQSKVYSGIASGTNCLITETKSDGAVASYKDNSGDNTTDGRVTIKRRPIGGCGDVLGLTGAPTAATPGGPAPTTTFNECWASVIITNDYNPPATTEAPKAAAAAPATAAPATAAPAVAPAPAVAVDATPTFAG